MTRAVEKELEKLPVRLPQGQAGAEGAREVARHPSPFGDAGEHRRHAIS